MVHKFGKYDIQRNQVRRAILSPNASLAVRNNTRQLSEVIRIFAASRACSLVTCMRSATAKVAAIIEG
jgi:hypothetical protein